MEPKQTSKRKETMFVFEAAKLLGVTPEHVRRLARSGRIRIRGKLGSFLVLNSADVRREAELRRRWRAQTAKIERM